MNQSGGESTAKTSAWTILLSVIRSTLCVSERCTVDQASDAVTEAVSSVVRRFNGEFSAQLVKEVLWLDWLHRVTTTGTGTAEIGAVGLAIDRDHLQKHTEVHIRGDNRHRRSAPRV